MPREVIDAKNIYGTEKPLEPPLFFFKYRGDWRPIPVTYWQCIQTPHHFRSMPIMLNSNQLLNPIYWRHKEILFINYNGQRSMYRVQEIEELLDKRWWANLKEIT